MASPEKPRVYRLRNLPGHVDRLLATELLAGCASDHGILAKNIRISSLAYAVDPWTRSPTKTATLTFEGLPPNASLGTANHELVFRISGHPQPLILDDHFRGLTPLNDVDPDKHQFDCIVLSGLASHPFGSWQPHGSDKSFMWIRDELPLYLPNIRFVLYGYDTALQQSSSFQTIPDLANSFIDILKAEGWTSPTAKPLIFLSHSMGGVLLKQALLMLAGSGQREVSIANLVRGAIFFGVPSRGMAVDDVLAMLGDQPNKDALVAVLSEESDYLPQLETRFAGISFIRTVKLFWAYETKTTNTITRIKDKFSRSGPDIVLVTRDSATGGRCFHDPSTTIQVDENHSDMVKFFHGDHRIRIIASKLREIHGGSQAAPRLEGGLAVFKADESHAGLTEVGRKSLLKKASIGAQPPLEDPLVWDYKRIVGALRAPERDARIEQIDPNSSHTFHWVYDKQSIGLTQWLTRGQGIFWVSGKPGSGKSTLMKFVHRDPRTYELLHQWRSRRRQITANFFFHHSGTTVQKSYEGLLRSILGQILEAEPELLSVVKTVFSETYKARVSGNGLENLQSDIHQLLSSCDVEEDADIRREISDLIADQDPLAVLQNLTRREYRSGHHELEMGLVRRRDDLLFAGVTPEPKHFFNCQLHKSLLPKMEEFSELVTTWLQALNIEARLCQLLLKRGVEITVERPGVLTEAITLDRKGTVPADISDERFERTRAIKRNIDTLLRRHSARSHIRFDIQRNEWPRQQLEEVLRRICAQELFDLDLVLLLDALDEYDGRPEFISGFLKDLTANETFAHTSVRILFSSRPWSIFKEEFSTCPGFEIHEHTREDIHNYCITSVLDSSQKPEYLLPLVDEIVRRSKGVFLWVKLVLTDLFRVLNDRSNELEDIQEQLYKKLNSLPDKLDEYYTSIIERISPASRWNTYVVLESLARSNFALSHFALVNIIEISTWQTFSYARVQRMFYEYFEMAHSLIWEVTGGLVDIGYNHVELMHQTVKEFIEAPQFRQIVLGSRRGGITKENGHVFLSKYLVSLLSNDTKSQLAFHAREAERTAGTSQYEFLSTVPVQHFRLLSPDHVPLKGQSVVSSVTLAAFSGLRLYFEDADKADCSFVANSSKLVLSALHHGMQNGLCAEDAIKTAESLVSKGLIINNDLPGLSKIVSSIWHSGDCSSKTRCEHRKEDYIRLCRKLLDKIKDGNISLSWKNVTVRRGAYWETICHGYLLHASSPELAEVLLSRGADPSAANSSGYSPLDYVLSSESIHCRSVQHLHDMTLVLVNHGGTLRKTTRREWDAFVQHLENYGLETQTFRDKGFPRWYQGTESSRGRERGGQ